MREFFLKEKPSLVEGESTAVAPDNDAAFGPWDSIAEFGEWYDGKGDIPNGLIIGVNQSDGTVARYEWNKPTGGTGQWVKIGSSAIAAYGETGRVTGGNESVDVDFQIPCPIVDGVPYNGIEMVEVEEDGFFVVDSHFNVGFCITPDNVSSWVGGISSSGSSSGSSSDQSSAISALRYQVNRIISILGDFYDQSDSTGDSDGKIMVE